MDLRHDRRGDQLAFSREGAGVFEAPEAIPELSASAALLPTARTPPTQVDLRGTKPR